MAGFGFLFTLAIWIASAIPLFVVDPGSGGWLLGGLIFGAITAVLWSALIPLGGLGGQTWMVVVGIAALVGGGGLALYCFAVLLARGSGVHVEITQQ